VSVERDIRVSLERVKPVPGSALPRQCGVSPVCGAGPVTLKPVCFTFERGDTGTNFSGLLLQVGQFGFELVATRGESIYPLVQVRKPRLSFL
jgi:hypothetical protein